MLASNICSITYLSLQDLFAVLHDTIRQSNASKDKLHGRLALGQSRLVVIKARDASRSHSIKHTQSFNALTQVFSCVELLRARHGRRNRCGMSLEDAEGGGLESGLAAFNVESGGAFGMTVTRRSCHELDTCGETKACCHASATSG